MIDRAKYLDKSEVHKLRKCTEAQAIVDLKKGKVKGPVMWMLVDTALSTGLRVSEMAALNVEDIDLKRGCLTVKRLKRKSKTSKPVKETLMIGKELAAHLKDYLAWRDIRLKEIEEKYRNGKLLIGQRGKLSAQGLQQIWKAAVRWAGLPKELSIHSARHTLAVTLLKKKGNLRMVQKQLGHTSPVTTANMYADVSPDDMQDAVTGLYDDNEGN